MKKPIKDLIFYLNEIDELRSKLSKDQKQELDTIIEVILTLLVSLKKSSNLGVVKYSFTRE